MKQCRRFRKPQVQTHCKPEQLEPGSRDVPIFSLTGWNWTGTRDL